MLKVGIIGSGRMGIQHLRAVRESKSGEIIAIADTRPNASEIKEIIGNEARIFISAQELFKNSRPDVVHVVTPPGTHYEYGKMALENGAHVFIEKPFVLEGKQAEELAKMAMDRGLKLCAGYQLLAHSATKKAEAYVSNIGEIIHVESYFAFRKVRKSISAVDQAIDIVPHPVYTLLHFLSIGCKADNGFVVKALDVEADGEIRAIIEHEGRKGILLVTLKGRPVDSYLKIVGTNGTVHIDYVRGVVINLSGSGADAVAAVITPYRQTCQTAWKTTKALARMTLKKTRSYEGLAELIDDFYECILKEREPLIRQEFIIETVKTCERIGLALKEKEKTTEEFAKARLDAEARLLPSTVMRETVLVTGGSGFLGRAICRELRAAGWPVRGVSRSISRFSDREPGVEYMAFDLADGIPPEALVEVTAVIHCAAETSGGKEDQERNSVEATQKVFEAAAAAGVKRFIHISSLAVLKPGKNSGKPLDEASPVDSDNLGRGAYVWGKAKAEETVVALSRQLDIDAKIVRPGPLVDFKKFEAPGRLGREIGSYFVVMGSRKSRLSVCDVRTAAKVVGYYLSDYESAPRVLNLVEPQALTRQDLISRLFEKRKDLKALFIPGVVVSIISTALYALQKVLYPSRKPMSIAKAFSSESYSKDIAMEITSKLSTN